MVKDLDLEVAPGEFLVLLGPSGCGKTTGLRMIAGLEVADSGQVLLGESDVTNVLPKYRDVAMVFQSYALYPHKTVAENIGFPLKVRGVPPAERARTVREAAAQVHMEDLLERYPRQLSGGQRQRVALARAIVRRPSVFLMDEPLSNLDAKLRGYMRAELKHMQHELGVTTVYVTHDQVEAMTLAHRVAVMDQGVLQQIGPPREVYDQPANLFVAGFMGSPPMNLVSGEVASGRFEGQGVSLPVEAARRRGGAGLPPRGRPDRRAGHGPVRRDRVRGGAHRRRDAGHALARRGEPVGQDAQGVRGRLRPPGRGALPAGPRLPVRRPTRRPPAGPLRGRVRPRRVIQAREGSAFRGPSLEDGSVDPLIGRSVPVEVRLGSARRLFRTARDR